MQFENLNNVTLHYQVIGAPEGKPVIVFSNSLGTDFRIWRDVIVQLVGEFSIVTYDKRGHGLSDAPPAPYKIDDHVADLAALLDHLKVKDAIICGLSVGGLIAQGLTLTRPDLVKALVLCDTAHKIGDAALWNGRIKAVSEIGISAISELILSRWFSKEFRSTQVANFTGYRHMLERISPEGYMGTSAAIRDTDFTEQAPNIKVPTLCIVGSEDGATPPALVGELSKLIPGAGYEIIQGSGHLPCVEKPEALYDLMHPFLKKLG